MPKMFKKKSSSSKRPASPTVEEQERQADTPQELVFEVENLEEVSSPPDLNLPLPGTSQEGEEEAEVAEVSQQPGGDSQQEEEESPQQPQVPQKRKRVRVSKREIQDYPFTEDQQKMLAEYVQENEALFNKRTKEWSNPQLKERLWEKCAELFPNCSGQQCRKYFEAKRTDFGKIEKRMAGKSGAAARRTTLREDKVLEIWGFLGGHIAHEKTISSQEWPLRTSPPRPAPAAAPVDTPITPQSHSSGESGLSAASLERRRRLRTTTGTAGKAKPTQKERSHGSQMDLQFSDLVGTIRECVPRLAPPMRQPDSPPKVHPGMQFVLHEMETLPKEFKRDLMRTFLDLVDACQGDQQEGYSKKKAIALGRRLLNACPTTDRGAQTDPLPRTVTLATGWQQGQGQVVTYMPQPAVSVFAAPQQQQQHQPQPQQQLPQQLPHQPQRAYVSAPSPVVAPNFTPSRMLSPFPAGDFGAPPTPGAFLNPNLETPPRRARNIEDEEA